MRVSWNTWGLLYCRGDAEFSQARRFLCELDSRLIWRGGALLVLARDGTFTIGDRRHSR